VYISHVKIKNFRSIVEEQFYPNKVNIFVGNNDVGKSNFLKALNLFFNEQTDSGQGFRFDVDYCYFAQKGAKQAPEITIEIEFSPPSSYMGGRKIKCKKVYRKEGLKTNEVKYSDGTEIGGRTKVRYWQEHLQYKYIPAIKSNEYFQDLLRDLHDTLSQTAEHKLKSAATEFIEKIKTNTSDISKNLLDKIGIQSSIQLPADLKELFSTLDFQTKKEGKDVSLRQRGDGIKIRHIPIILKFLAEQQNKNLTSGAVRINTIWGFEEPENNLEMSKAFSLSEEFLGYADSIQQFITSHSPSLYSLGREHPDVVNVYHVDVNDQEKSSKINKVDATGTDKLDAKMGLMAVVTPHVLKKNKEVSELKSLADRLQAEVDDITAPTLFVEGPTDHRIMKKALSVLTNGGHSFKIKQGGGHSWVHDMMMAWAHSRKTVKAAGLFDNELYAKESKKKLDDNAKCQTCYREQLMKSFVLDTPEHLHALFKNGVQIPVSIEEMFPVFVWEFAESNDWLEQRSEIAGIVRPPVDVAVVDYLKSKGLTKDQIRYATWKVQMRFKDHFATYVCTLKGEKLKETFQPFTNLVNKITDFFK
jgi:hypothetical protein